MSTDTGPTIDHPPLTHCKHGIDKAYRCIDCLEAALTERDHQWREKVTALVAVFRKYERGGESASGISDIAKGNGLAWKKAAEMLQELLEDSE